MTAAWAPASQLPKQVAASSLITSDREGKQSWPLVVFVFQLVFPTKGWPVVSFSMNLSTKF